MVVNFRVFGDNDRTLHHPNDFVIIPWRQSEELGGTAVLSLTRGESPSPPIHTILLQGLRQP